MLPPVLERICEEQRGLVLCTGTTGSGKSTTLAAMIDHINALRSEHIVTIEDPIEFLHRDKKSIVNQREIDVDTRGFSVALRSALRQDPDVILVGEMRDYETIETALLAAETGHLVFSTLHTLDATETINRIIAVFPPHHQKQIRIQLGAGAQGGHLAAPDAARRRHRPRAGGGGHDRRRRYIRECIENKEKTKYIREQIALGTSQYGMQTFDQSLFQLYKSGLITLEEALKRASNPDEFKLKLQGVQFTSDVSREADGAALEAPRRDRRSSQDGLRLPDRAHRQLSRERAAPPCDEGRRGLLGRRPLLFAPGSPRGSPAVATGPPRSTRRSSG